MPEQFSSDPTPTNRLDEFKLHLIPANVREPNPGTQMWQIITGHKNIVNQDELYLWINRDGKITIPHSELDWYSDDGKTILSDEILGLTPEKLLEASVMGMSDHVRMVAVTDEAYETFNARLNNALYETTSMSDDMGIVISGVEISGVKVAKKHSSSVIKVEETTEKGYLLVIKSSNLKNTGDWFTVTNEIRKLDPKGADDMLLDQLSQAALQAIVAKEWREDLVKYAYNFHIPEAISKLANDAQSMALTYINMGKYIAAYLENTFHVFDSTRLDNLKNISRIIKEMNEDDKDFHQKRSERMQLFTSSLMNKLKADPTKEDQILRHASSLWKRAMIQAAKDQQTYNKLGNILREQDNGKGIILALTERAARLYPEKMKASPAARKLYYQKTKTEAPIDWTMKDFVSWQAESSLARALIAQRGGLKRILERSGAKEPNFRKLLKITEDKIVELTKEYHDGSNLMKFPIHPMDNLRTWETVLNDVQKQAINLGITEHQWALWKNLWDLKRQIALNQAIVIDKILNTMGNPEFGFNGGISGWNYKYKGDIDSALESAPATGANLKEINCTGRMLLLVGMMLTNNLIPEENIKVATSKQHTFMGMIDELGVGRRLEISGTRHDSGFGGMQSTIEQSTVYGKKTTISWTAWRKGVAANLLTNFQANISRSNLILMEKIINDIYPNYYDRIRGR